MLLPIGHEETTVRRMPWVTFTVMGLCIAAWLLGLIVPANEGLVAARERSAVDYWSAHPYLELAPELRGTTWLTIRQQIGDLPPEPEDRGVRVGEQRELDRRVSDYLGARDALPYFRWGLVPASIKPLAFITHQFVHGGFLHLFGNLFILYLVGPFLEDAWGRVLYSGFYLSSGVVAAMVFIARYPHLDEPMIGASGAIAGVMGAFAVRFWDTRIVFFYWIFFLKIYTGTFAAPAWLMLGLWCVREIVFAMGLWALVGLGDAGEVAFLAHVGGFAFGVAVALAVRALGVEERWVRPALDRRETVHDAGDVAHALDLAGRGETGAALAALERRLDEQPGDPDAAAALWRVARDRGEVSRAIPRVLAALRRAAQRGEVGLAALVWREVLEEAPEGTLDLAIGIRTGELLAAADLPGEAELTLEWARARVDEHTPSGLASRLERLAGELGGSAEACRQGHGSPPSATAASRPEGAVPVRPAADVVVVAVPLALGPDALELEADGRRRRLALTAIAGCRVAVIAAPGERPYLVVDLQLTSPEPSPSRRLVRLRACDFDPRALVAVSHPMEALAELVRRLGGSMGDPRGLPRYASEAELTS